MVLGKSIRIYLKDGTATGIRVCEWVNHTIQSISSPRLKTSELSDFKESNRPGVYFLFGKDESSNEDLAYIGEAENVFDRLQNHLLNKEFWNEVVIFVSKDENLTKAHVKYLESRIIQLAFAAKRYQLENYNQPQLSSLPLADRDAMEEFLLQIKMLIGIHGHRILEDYVEKPSFPVRTDVFTPTVLKPSTPDTALCLSVAGLNANAVQTNEGLVVLTGSDATKNVTPSLSPGYAEYRQKLIENSSLQMMDDKLRFARDTLFSSPSAAAAIIVGYNFNGLQAWKNKEGKSLKTIEAERVSHASDSSQTITPVL